MEVGVAMVDEDFEVWDGIESCARRFREAADTALARQRPIDTHALDNLIAEVVRERAHHASVCPTARAARLARCPS